jgi:hypothetical protein
MLPLLIAFGGWDTSQIGVIDVQYGDQLPLGVDQKWQKKVVLPKRLFLFVSVVVRCSDIIITSILLLFQIGDSFSDEKHIID